MTRTALIVFVTAWSSAAFAGPPQFSSFQAEKFVSDDAGLWLVGKDQCFEGGSTPHTVQIAPRTGATTAAQPPHDDVVVAGKGKLPKDFTAGPTWSAGNDVFIAGFLRVAASDGDYNTAAAVVSHDRGATWSFLKPPETWVAPTLFGGTSADDVYLVGASLNGRGVYNSRDHGKTWKPVDVKIEPRPCLPDSYRSRP